MSQVSYHQNYRANRFAPASAQEIVAAGFRLGLLVKAPTVPMEVKSGRGRGPVLTDAERAAKKKELNRSFYERTKRAYGVFSPEEAKVRRKAARRRCALRENAQREQARRVITQLPTVEVMKASMTFPPQLVPARVRDLVKAQELAGKVMASIAKGHGLRVEDLLERVRTPEADRIRCIAMYVAKVLTQRGAPCLAVAFQRDSTALTYAFWQAEERMVKDADFKAEVERWVKVFRNEVIS